MIIRRFVIALAVCLVTVLAAHAVTSGRAGVSVNGTYTLTASESSNVFVENLGTGTIYVAWGGYSVASTNDPATYYANRMPISAGASYTTRGRFSVVSVYCETNGLINVGFEGVE